MGSRAIDASRPVLTRDGHSQADQPSVRPRGSGNPLIDPEGSSVGPKGGQEHDAEDERKQER